jgi:trigger factor
MQVTTEQIDPCKIALTISVEPEKVKVAKEKAFKQAASNLQLPGFRKGKVPVQLAKPYVDESRVRQRAAELLVGPAYADALQETQVEPFGNLGPEMELVEFPEGDDGTFVFKALVPLRPVVTIGLYKGLTVEKRTLEVTDEDIDRQIEEVRSRHAEYPEAGDRNAQTGDVILADLTAEIEGQETPELAEPRATVIEIGKNIPDFDNGLVGMAVGETKTIEAIYPDSFADEKMRGKRATFTVTVKEIRAKVLPELTEEFIKKVRPEASNEEELRAQTRQSLEEAARQMADNDLEFEIVGKIVETSQVNYPDALLRAEMQADVNSLQERLQRENATFEQYLQMTGRTQQEVEQEFAAAADRRIRNSLVLSEIARTEELTVDEADIDAQIQTRAESAKVSPAAVRAFLEKNNQLDQVRDQALTEKILNFLREQTTITERTVTAEEMRQRAQEQAGAGVAEIEAEAAQISAESQAEGAAAALESPVGVAIEDAKPKRRTKKAADAAPAEGAGEAEGTDAASAE